MNDGAQRDNIRKDSTWKGSSRSGVVTIRGVQSGYGQEDVTEVSMPAKYVKKDGKRFLFYKEYEEGGSSQQVRLTIEHNQVTLKKTGFGSSLLHFHKGHKEPCRYQSPVGVMDLISHTRAIQISEGEHSFTLKMEYSLYMHEQNMSDYKLRVHWIETKE